MPLVGYTAQKWAIGLKFLPCPERTGSLPDWLSVTSITSGLGLEIDTRGYRLQPTYIQRTIFFYHISVIASLGFARILQLNTLPQAWPELRPQPSTCVFQNYTIHIHRLASIWILSHV